MTENEGELPDIFSYIDYHHYLRDCFAARREGNARFSLRLFARLAGVKSSGSLNMVIVGERGLSVPAARRYAQALGLDAIHREYFENMVLYEMAHTDGEKEKVLRQMQTLSARQIKAKYLSTAEYDFFRHRHYVVVREMVTLAAFCDDPDWIAGRLLPPIKPQQAREALMTLQNLGLIEKGESGRYRQTDVSVYTPPQVGAVELFHNYLEQLKAAKTALFRIPGDERIFNCITVPLNRKLFDCLQEKISSFQQEILNLVNAASDGYDDVYQISIFAFPATRVSRK